MTAIITCVSKKSLNCINRHRSYLLSCNQVRNKHRWPVSLVERKQRDLYHGVVPKIGLEVHAQLDLKSKLFSQGCNTTTSPNSGLDLLDIALPGSLPTLNGSAVRAGLLASLGLNCTIQDKIHFDRKNYFYSDMPAGYQITQYHKPLAKDGHIDYIVTAYQKPRALHTFSYDLMKYLWEQDPKSDELKPYLRRSRITQIQLEQDSAKTLHQLSEESGTELYTLIDYNRSGAALIEIVFEPDLVNHHEASSLVKELIRVLKATGVCNCEMQSGSLRVDANVSIFSVDDEMVDSERVELKNLNSINFVNRAILHEIRRQSGILKAGGRVIRETRFFDPKSDQTTPLRLKENAVDYRYTPEPNIPPLKIDKKYLDQVAECLPQVMPAHRTERLLHNDGLDLELAAQILDDPTLGDYFDQVIALRPNMEASVIADFLLYNQMLLKRLPWGNMDGPELECPFSRLSPDLMVEILDLLESEKVSFVIACELVKLKALDPSITVKPTSLVEKFSWQQINNEEDIDRLCGQVIAGMVQTQKKYRKRGYMKDLRRLLDKLGELNDNRVNIRLAIASFDKQLRNGDKTN